MYNYRKKNYVYTYKDFYKSYKNKKKAEGIKVPDIIPESTYVKAIEAFMMLVFIKIVKEAFIFILPYNLGHIFLKSRKFPPSKAPINWVETKKQKKKVRYLCNHSYGYYFYICWKKDHVYFKNKRVYRFKLNHSQAGRKKGVGKKLIGDHILEVSKDPTRKIIRY